MLSATRSEGGCGTILAKGAAKPHSFMSLIPLCFSPANRPHPRRSRKIGEDDSDPPKTGGACGPDSGALFHMPSIRPHAGRYRPHLSLREGSEEQPPGGGAERRETDSMKWRRFIPHILLFFGGLGYALWSFVRRPFPMLGDSPLLDLMDYHTPNFYGWVMLWYYASPFVAVMLAGLILMSVWKVWLEARRRDFAPFGALPTWPLSTQQTAPAIVIGEVHHPVEAREIFNPSWLTIPERGLYTGVAIFGAVGSGKTSACMHPFAKQLLGWQAGNPQMRAAALMLEVKGDFCHDIRRILIDAGRGKDYIELGMNGRWQWNPLSAWWLDSYSLAYTVSSLLNQLFGKGKEPFWQQAYTNLVRWIIELHRIFPERWVTLQQVYRCAIDPDLFAAKIEQAEAWSDELNKGNRFRSGRSSRREQNEAG